VSELIQHNHRFVVKRPSCRFWVHKILQKKIGLAERRDLRYYQEDELLKELFLGSTETEDF
jgi:hypothetical protein